MRQVLSAALLAVLLFASGCSHPEEPFARFLFMESEASPILSAHPARLAEVIFNQTGYNTRIYLVPENQMIVQALAAGQGDAAFVHAASAWYARESLSSGFEVAGILQDSEGNAWSAASLVVRTNSSFENLSDLRGSRSCHTGLLTSETLLVLLQMESEELVDLRSGDSTFAAQQALNHFFNSSLIPFGEGHPYGGNAGALRCLSEGLGDVAFIDESAPSKYCSTDTPREWCLPLGDYRILQTFEKIPYRVLLVAPGSSHKVGTLREIFAVLPTNPEGLSAMRDVLDADGLLANQSVKENLTAYGGALGRFPGLMESKSQRAFISSEWEAHEAYSPD